MICLDTKRRADNMAESGEAVVERLNARDAQLVRERASKPLLAGPSRDGARETPTLRFEALSPRTLEVTKKLSNAIFALEGDAAGKDLEASLTSAGGHRGAEPQYTQRNYWVAKDASGRVVGVTGLYALSRDRPNHCWLGWFALTPEMRGRELGKTMLEFTMRQAHSKGKEHLYIVSSDHPTMAGNAKFYHRNGCPIVAVLDRSGNHLSRNARALPESVVKELREHYAALIDAGVSITIRGRIILEG